MKKLILLVTFALFIQLVKGNLTSSFTSVENVYSLKSNNSSPQAVFVLAIKSLDGLKLTAEKNWSKF